MLRNLGLIVLVLALMVAGWKIFKSTASSQVGSNSSGSNTSAEPGRSKTGHKPKKSKSFVMVDGYQHDLVPLEPCGSLGESGSGVLAGTVGSGGEFLPGNRQLLIRSGANYAYAAYYSGEGGSVTRYLCTGQNCVTFDAKTRTFVGEISEATRYEITCAEHRGQDG
ncbi:MAG: hypothetical protein AAF385_02705 [Pseudomonadota bacterium]